MESVGITKSNSNRPTHRFFPFLSSPIHPSTYLPHHSGDAAFSNPHVLMVLSMAAAFTGDPSPPFIPPSPIPLPQGCYIRGYIVDESHPLPTACIDKFSRILICLLFMTNNPMLAGMIAVFLQSMGAREARGLVKDLLIS